MGSFGVLDLGLFGGGVDKRWNFNGCGVFVGRFWGVGDYIIKVGGGGFEVVEGLSLVGLVVVGRG